MKEHNNEASTQWQIGLKALLSLLSTPDSTQTHVKNTVATITQTKKSFAPIHLTRNRLRRASVTFEVSISCSVLHTRSIRYSHKSQNDWKDSVRLLQPVLVVFDKKEIASVNKVRNQQQLHPYSAMVNASPERVAIGIRQDSLPSLDKMNNARFIKLLCDTQSEMTRPVTR